MWCLGVLLYELATLRYPFQADNFSSLVVRIIEGKYEPISRWGLILIHHLFPVGNLCAIFSETWKPTVVSLVVVITTAQHLSKKLGLSFYARSNPGRGLSEICDCKNVWQWFRLKIRLNAFRWSDIPLKQLISIIFMQKIICRRNFDKLKMIHELKVVNQ